MILLNNAVKNRQGPVLRPASVRAHGRVGAGESPGGGSGNLGGSRRLCGASREVWEGAGGFRGVPVLVGDYFLGRYALN